MKRRVDIAHGSKAKRAKVIDSNAEFVIINYDGVESVRSELALGGFDLIVLDEANYIKTATTKRWKMINSLIGPDTWVWMLTGTPAAQSPLDAYGLAKMMNPTSVPQFVGLFRDRVMLKISAFKYIPKPEAQQVVHEVLQPAIRFTKDECLDLPELLYSERDTPLTAQQEKYYKLLKKEMLIQVASADITAFNAAVGMNKLLQISCIAYNTPVLTDVGWVPIQEVTTAHRVWDGEEWVAHDGLACRGLKEVRECYGVRMTSDHRVLTTAGWQTAEDIIYGKSSKRFNRTEVRVPDSYRESWNDERNFGAMRDVALPVRLWAARNSQESVSKSKAQEAPKKLRMPPRQRETQNEQKASVFKLSQHGSALSRSFRQGLQKLRRTWNCGVRTLAVFIRDVLVGYGAYAQGRAYARQDRQQRPVFTGELPVGYTQGSGAQHEGEHSYRHTEWKNDCSTSSRGIRTQVCHLEKTPEGGLAYRFGTESVPKQREATYDLLNCGPRSRFVVAGKEGPVIVHNCGSVYSDSGEVVEFDCKNKLEEMLEVVQESSHKVLIFCNFRHSIDMVQTYLEKQGITTATIHGGVSAKRRAEIFNDFQTTPNPHVLIIQPQSAAHGVTLTAANTIIWFGPVTSAEIWLQANARVHRAGQRNPCLVVKLVSSAVERQLYKALEERTLAQETLLDMYQQELTG